MKSTTTLGLFACLALVSTSATAQPTTPNSNRAGAEAVVVSRAPANGAEQAEIQELMQGPLHEAFAAPVVFDPEPARIITKVAPQPIKEVQPTNKPDGANVNWISGYWAYDADRSDFLWVSGIWRVAPPDHQWKPGSWIKASNGNQWVSGYWQQDLPNRASERAFLPKPPKSLESGPISPQPDDQHVWIPGYWDYNNTDYVWSAGYWSRGYADRVYVPANYVWYPDGYVRTGGYWDYPVATRGLLFAPVQFQSPIYTRAGYSYTPSHVVSSSFFLDNMFASPGYGHYYFGDYYDPKYTRLGIYPTYSPSFLKVGYSSSWEHNWWRHGNVASNDNWGRHDSDWDDNKWDRSKHKTLREAYQAYRQQRFDRLSKNNDARPSHNVREFLAKAPAAGSDKLTAAIRPYTEVIADKQYLTKFSEQSKQSVESARKAIVEDRTKRPGQEISDERKMFAPGATPGTAGDAKPARDAAMDNARDIKDTNTLPPVSGTAADRIRDINDTNTIVPVTPGTAGDTKAARDAAMDRARDINDMTKVAPLTPGTAGDTKAARDAAMDRAKDAKTNTVPPVSSNAADRARENTAKVTPVTPGTAGNTPARDAAMDRTRDAKDATKAAPASGPSVNRARNANDATKAAPASGPSTDSTPGNSDTNKAAPVSGDSGQGTKDPGAIQSNAPVFPGNKARPVKTLTSEDQRPSDQRVRDSISERIQSLSDEKRYDRANSMTDTIVSDSD